MNSENGNYYPGIVYTDLYGTFIGEYKDGLAWSKTYQHEYIDGGFVFQNKIDADEFIERFNIRDATFFRIDPNIDDGFDLYISKEILQGLQLW